MTSWILLMSSFMFLAGGILVVISASLVTAQQQQQQQQQRPAGPDRRQLIAELLSTVDLLHSLSTVAASAAASDAGSETTLPESSAYIISRAECLLFVDRVSCNMTSSSSSSSPLNNPNSRIRLSSAVPDLAKPLQRLDQQSSSAHNDNDKDGDVADRSRVHSIVESLVSEIRTQQRDVFFPRFCGRLRSLAHKALSWLFSDETSSPANLLQPSLRGQQALRDALAEIASAAAAPRSLANADVLRCATHVIASIACTHMLQQLRHRHLLNFVPAAATTEAQYKIRKEEEEKCLFLVARRRWPSGNQSSSGSNNNNNSSGTPFSTSRLECQFVAALSFLASTVASSRSRSSGGAAVIPFSLLLPLPALVGTPTTTTMSTESAKADVSDTDDDVILFHSDFLDPPKQPIQCYENNIDDDDDGDEISVFAGLQLVGQVVRPPSAATSIGSSIQQRACLHANKTFTPRAVPDSSSVVSSSEAQSCPCFPGADHGADAGEAVAICGGNFLQLCMSAPADGADFIRAPAAATAAAASIGSGDRWCRFFCADPRQILAPALLCVRAPPATFPSLHDPSVALPCIINNNNGSSLINNKNASASGQRGGGRFVVDDNVEFTSGGVRGDPLSCEYRVLDLFSSSSLPFSSASHASGTTIMRRTTEEGRPAPFPLPHRFQLEMALSLPGRDETTTTAAMTAFSPFRVEISRSFGLNFFPPISPSSADRVVISISDGAAARNATALQKHQHFFVPALNSQVYDATRRRLFITAAVVFNDDDSAERSFSTYSVSARWSMSPQIVFRGNLSSSSFSSSSSSSAEEVADGGMNGSLLLRLRVYDLHRHHEEEDGKKTSSQHRGAVLESVTIRQQFSKNGTLRNSARFVSAVAASALDSPLAIRLMALRAAYLAPPQQEGTETTTNSQIRATTLSPSTSVATAQPCPNTNSSDLQSSSLATELAVAATVFTFVTGAACCAFVIWRVVKLK